MIRAFVLTCLSLLAGCNASSSCRWPAGVRGYDDAGGTGVTTDGGIATGCAASRGFNDCEVMDDGTQKCTDLCASSEYSLGCYGGVIAPATLECRGLPIFGPMGFSAYCCPCAH